MERTQVVWSGDVVTGGGLTTFYSDEGIGTPVLANLVTFFNAIKALFPGGITWTIPDGGDLIDEASGALTGTWSESGGGVVTSTGGTSPYVAGVGARAVWRTSAIRGGRRVRGSTFLLPLLTTQYDASGTIGPTALSTLENAAQTLLGSATSIGVWSRPRPGLSGALVPIDSVSVPDKVSWLRSRRT